MRLKPDYTKIEAWQMEPSYALRPYDSVFVQSKASQPLAWFWSFTSLMRAADVVLEQAEHAVAVRALPDYVRDVETSKEVSQAIIDQNLFIHASLLYGFAMENGFKAMIISGEPNFDYLKDRALLSVRPAHDLAKLAQRTQIFELIEDSEMRWFDYFCSCARRRAISHRFARYLHC